MSLSFKDGKLMTVEAEFLKVDGQREYDIMGIESSKNPIFMYRKSQQIFETIPSGSYTIVLDAHNHPDKLRIDDDILFSKALSFQILYQHDFDAGKYLTTLVDTTILKDNYNTLVDVTKVLWEYIRNMGMIKDSRNLSIVIPELKDGETFAWDGVNQVYYGIQVADLQHEADSKIAQIRIFGDQKISEIDDHIENTSKPAIASYWKHEVDDYVTNSAKPEIDAEKNTNIQAIADKTAEGLKSIGDTITAGDTDITNTINTGKSGIESLVTTRKAEINTIITTGKSDLNTLISDGKTGITQLTDAKKTILQSFTNEKLQDLTLHHDKLINDNGVMPDNSVITDQVIGRWWIENIENMQDSPSDLAPLDKAGYMDIEKANNRKIIKYFASSGLMLFKMQVGDTWTDWIQSIDTGDNYIKVGQLGGEEFKFAPVKYAKEKSTWILADKKGADAICVNGDGDGGLIYHDGRINIPVGASDSTGHEFVSGEYYFLEPVSGKFLRSKPMSGLFQVLGEVALIHNELFFYVDIDTPIDITPFILTPHAGGGVVVSAGFGRTLPDPSRYKNGTVFFKGV